MLIICVNLTAVPLAAVVIPKIAHDYYGSSRIGGIMLAADGIGVIAGGIPFGIIGRRLTAYRSMFLRARRCSVLSRSCCRPCSVPVASGWRVGPHRYRIRDHGAQQSDGFRQHHRRRVQGRLLGFATRWSGSHRRSMVVIVGVALDFFPVRSSFCCSRRSISAR